MTAAELREALRWERGEDVDFEALVNPPRWVLAEAARLWLRILEGDEQTVEKVAEAVCEWDIDAGISWGGLLSVDSPDVEYYRNGGRAVLAALAEGET